MGATKSLKTTMMNRKVRSVERQSIYLATDLMYVLIYFFVTSVSVTPWLICRCVCVWMSFQMRWAVHSRSCVNSFLGSGESSTMRAEDNKFKNETNVWVRSSGALLRDPDSEIPRVPLPRLFQDHCCSSFIFSTIKPCFFWQVQMGKLDGSSLGIKRSIIGGWSAGLFTLVALGVVRQVRLSVIF